MYWSPYGSGWNESIPHLSRFEILEKEFGADTTHPVRRLLIGLTMTLTPIVVIATVIGVSFLAR
jgi:hypothetical protein